ALAAAGDRAGALMAFERCRQALQDELSVEPDAETTALYEQIRAGETKRQGDKETRSTASPGLPVSLSERHNLPAALTPLVGREPELAELSELLRAPETRLLTIVGAGGMGKTRLALELARATLESFGDGVYFVALAPLASADALAST